MIEHHGLSEATPSDEWVSLNVGGKIFKTTRSTLTSDPNSVLYKMFNRENQFMISHKDNHGCYLIDRDPKYFRCVLNFLRFPSTKHPPIIDDGISIQGVLQEAQFFQIDGLIKVIEKAERSKSDLDRKDIMIYRNQIKLTNKRLLQIDLSNMDFTKESFNNSIISKSNLSYSKLNSSTLLQITGKKVNFNYCKAENALFSNSNLNGSTFDRSDLSHASFNNCQLADSTFESAICQGSLFQRANLINARFKNADLQHAKFQKSTLYGCDFTGALISNCHFTAASLQGATFDWDLIFKTYNESELRLFKKSRVTQQQLDQHIPLAYRYLFKVVELPNDINRNLRLSIGHLNPFGNNINNNNMNQSQDSQKLIDSNNSINTSQNNINNQNQNQNNNNNNNNNNQNNNNNDHQT
ncbi:hypothetical protein DFA_07885 [Cavenderia fasciculata]|uniref:BTB domain-containing protein n=1 Tax=Cavenderia fasciculata TaxID=261658 RepID=F4Q3T8_CACFS|nr:uncharacterized protein DFA_07885 [Cavenderia fasciculata]EGG16904.1 hypothetical protein DFA_07885 [Cavenderia fasciculata]|eukprot:XP_004355378.1 hypothetical protein DFA_07885 [Cavenderia fasciculata]